MYSYRQATLCAPYHLGLSTRSWPILKLVLTITLGWTMLTNWVDLPQRFSALTLKFSQLSFPDDKFFFSLGY